MVGDALRSWLNLLQGIKKVKMNKKQIEFFGHFEAAYCTNL